MNLDKIYYDVFGNEKNILQMVKAEPEWAAHRIQAGEEALNQVAALTAENAQLNRRIDTIIIGYQLRQQDAANFKIL
jgi:hypothetical protein